MTNTLVLTFLDISAFQLLKRPLVHFCDGGKKAEGPSLVLILAGRLLLDSPESQPLGPGSCENLN